MKKQVKISPFSSYGLRSFISFCRLWRFKLVFVALLFIVGNLLVVIQPVFIGSLVDSVTGAVVNPDRAWFFAFLMILASVIQTVVWHGADFAYRLLVLDISFKFETHMFREVIAKPYEFFVGKFTGKVGSYITNISSEMRNFLASSMYDYIGSIITVISVVIIMTSINWQTGFIVTFCVMLQFIVGKFALAKDMIMQKIETDVASTKNGHIVDAVANFVSVKSFKKELAEYKNILSRQNDTYTAARQSFFWGTIFWVTQSLLVRIFMWPAVVALNLWMFLQGDISVGQFTTVLTTALLFTESIWTVISHVAQFGERVSRVEEAHVYLFGPKNIAKETDLKLFDKAPTTRFDRTFEIKNLNFTYPDNLKVQVLKDVSIHLKRGEKLGIVGRSGSGKSTLTKLLLDQYHVSDGVFELDGRQANSKSLSELMTYVPQDTALFHRSIADNIAYAANGQVTRQQIIQVAKDAMAHEFIVELSEGYDTLVGERGVKLSGGQRQRIAIARAMLRDAPILILDEATSALDSESEIYVQKALETLWREKTVIAIAHRLSTLRNMDRIIVMSEGKIAEGGSHSELLAQSGMYAKLWQHQSGGFIEE